MKNKTQNGITLVALIITIIVLLILATVTIRGISENGIIAHAKNAKTKYEEAAEKENALLSTLYGERIDEEIGTPLAQVPEGFSTLNIPEDGFYIYRRKRISRRFSRK